ncbi:putative flagellar hook-length control protein [Legionella nautarum]|uniref:Putative flagellar hook-length control protein n=1 Tax=Legionella nautarum TaxID=45070 RepID=A0A0W0WUZ8_9GAMM|nr:flagellar hook-length control protein FliK [Legionella nautarum]KTD36147.1 putative flagellar hook-length control protein [Legionella nautarum]
MMNLIQLLFSQPMSMDTLSSEEQIDNGEAEGSAFLALIEHFFAEVDLTPSEQSLAVKEDDQLIDIEDKNRGVIDPAVTLMTNPELPKKESSEEESAYPLVDKNQDESLTINNSQLAWFDADFFIPPSEKMRQELNQTDKNLEHILLPTTLDNKESSVSQEIIKNANEIAEIDEQNKIEQESECQFEALPKVNENLLALKMPELVQDSSFQNQIAQAISHNLTQKITSKSEIVKPNENPEKVENTQVQAIFNSNESPVTPKIELLGDFGQSDKELEPEIENKLTNDPAFPLQNNPKFALEEQQLITAKTIELPQHLEHPDWSEHFNQQIVWLGQQNIKTAIIKLNPQELGPIEININVKQEDASVNITLHRSQVHEIIENAIPRLREMMAEQGLNLTQVSIESHHQRQNPQSRQYEHSIEKKQANSELFEEQPLEMKVKNGLIDYFA